MKHFITRIYESLEFSRYKILTRDTIISSFYRSVINFCYPLFGSRIMLESKFVNHRNREGVSLYELITAASNGNKRLKKDLVLCYYFYHIVPWEYKLYHFENQSHKERLCWLSDADRYMICELLMGTGPYLALKNKAIFHKLLKKYYKRPVMAYHPETTADELEKFYKSNSGEFFVKPINGSLGRNTFKVSSTAENTLYEILKEKKGSWIIEGSIVQSPLTAQWNPTSVNTIRIPSFRSKNGWHILQPFFRTGRKGQIVDNAGAGGILCVVDELTGGVISDGYDESSHVYEIHPDSNIKYKGWKIPYFDELLELTKEIHRSLPENFLYVGFDFALTEKGWDLIEGNWGQFIGQIAAQKGIKKQFDTYIGLC